MKNTLFALVATAAIAATSLCSVVPASALELHASKHYVWRETSVQAWNSGDNPQAFAGAQPLVATSYLTVTVRTDKAGDKVAYRLTYDGQTFDRFDTAGQTNGLHLARKAADTVGISLLSPSSGTTQSATNVSVSVCTDAHPSCPNS